MTTFNKTDFANAYLDLCNPEGFVDMVVQIRASYDSQEILCSRHMLPDGTMTDTDNLNNELSAAFFKFYDRATIVNEFIFSFSSLYGLEMKDRLHTANGRTIDGYDLNMLSWFEDL